MYFPNNLAVNLKGVGDCFDTVHYQLDPIVVEAQFGKGGLQVRPLDTVICFAHIQL